jgi:glycogen debranching enzyme
MALYSIETHGQLNPHLMQEWLLTNGIGGFSSSSVLGCNTRRYHGLLCAALCPPVGRFLALSHIGEALTFDGDDTRPFELSVNQFRQAFHPTGWYFLTKFELDDTARWEYVVEGVKVVKEVQMLWRQNAIGIRYTIQPARKRKIKMSLSPFFASFFRASAWRSLTNARNSDPTGNCAPDMAWINALASCLNSTLLIPIILSFIRDAGGFQHHRSLWRLGDSRFWLFRDVTLQPDPAQQALPALKTHKWWHAPSIG